MLNKVKTHKKKRYMFGDMFFVFWLLGFVVVQKYFIKIFIF